MVYDGLTLIIGGSSGLGHDLAKILSSEHDVYVTGRNSPGDVSFQYLDLSSQILGKEIDGFLDVISPIDHLIYAAGFYQEGKIDDLTDEDIMQMTNVGFVTPLLLLQRILKKQNSLPTFTAITSTSQWTPRLLEPVYNGVKAGLGMAANAVSLDERVGKTLVAAPAGMATPFWREKEKDKSNLLDSRWVAEKILELHEDDFKYRYARILREPPRVEIVETRT